jgi:hypothetical protein
VVDRTGHQTKRRDLLTPQLRHWYAFNGTLSGTPVRGVPRLCPLSEITSFELDSSRSRKSVVKLSQSHTFFSGHSDETMKQAWMQAPIFDTLTLWCPRRDAKTFFSLHPLKSVLVSRPLAGLFSILHPRTLLPRAPFRIANRPALEKGAQLRQPIPLTRNLRIAQSRGGPTTAEAQPRHISRQSETGADFGAKRSVHCTARLRLSMYCSPCFPLRSTLTVLDRLGDFASRISRREYRQEQVRNRRRTNAGGNPVRAAISHLFGYRREGAHQRAFAI